jgi:ABC-type lipoprotein export system ATPase subunit
MSSTLSIQNITKIFNQAGHEITLFKDLSAEFKQGVSYAITGVSGTGKSTLLALLAGLERPTHGQIFFNGRDIAYFNSEREQRAFFHRGVGIVFQSAYLVRELSVLENVMLKGLTTGIPFDVCTRRGLELLEQVELAHKAHASPATLSGGEQQRVAIIRALFLEPAFLLADEPTAHLDSEHKLQVLELLREYQVAVSMGLIIACHDPEIAETMDTRLRIDNRLLVTSQ